MRLFSPIHRYTDADENVIIAEWLCEYGVAKWENVFDDEAGTEIAYSNQQARRLFLNEEFYRSLNIFLLNAAKNYENFLHDKKEEDLAELKKL